MATITLTLEVPDAAVPLARRTLAAMTGEPVPTNATTTRAVTEKYLKMHLKNDALQQKQAEAADAARNDNSDGTVTW